MKQPSPTQFGFDPETKKFKDKESKERYRQYVVKYAKWVTRNQNKQQ